MTYILILQTNFYQETSREQTTKVTAKVLNSFGVVMPIFKVLDKFFENKT